MRQNIVNLIKNGLTIDFDYDENTGIGTCRLKYGIASIDIDTVKNIDQENKSSFLIRSIDILTEIAQTWIYKDGKEIKAEVSHDNFIIKMEK